MGAVLSGRKIAFIGGDQREIFLIENLLENNVQINIYGLPRSKALKKCNFTQNIIEAIEDVDAIIFPMAGVNEKKQVKNLLGMDLELKEDVFANISKNVPVFIGMARSFLKEWAKKYGVKIIEIANLDEIAIPNAIPTAEGAIQIAMEELPITISNSKSVVVGYGRCGKALAKVLKALGSQTVVVARKEADLVDIKKIGLIPALYKEMDQYITEADVIFNTVPALILDQYKLRLIKKDTLIIDIASKPGGIDFPVAEKLNIKAILAPGLPGKVAPKTAGLILAEFLPQIISGEISLTVKGKLGGENK